MKKFVIVPLFLHASVALCMEVSDQDLYRMSKKDRNDLLQQAFDQQNYRRATQLIEKCNWKPDEATSLLGGFCDQMLRDKRQITFKDADKVVKAFASVGADLNQKCDYSYVEFVCKEFFLQGALHSQNLPLAKALLAHGARIDVANREALHDAAEEGNSEKLALLLTYGNVNGKDQNGITPLIRAVKKVWLLDSRWSDYDSLSSKQAKILTCVRLLLDQKGVDVNARGERGWTALHYAAVAGHETLVETLLQHGADQKICDASPSVKQPRDVTTSERIKFLLRNASRPAY